MLLFCKISILYIKNWDLCCPIYYLFNFHSSILRPKYIKIYIIYLWKEQKSLKNVYSKRGHMLKNIYALLPLSEKFVIKITERLARAFRSLDFDFMHHFDFLLTNRAEKHWNALLAMAHMAKFFIRFTVWRVIFTSADMSPFQACARLSSNFNNLTTKFVERSISFFQAFRRNFPFIPIVLADESARAWKPAEFRFHSAARCHDSYSFLFLHSPSTGPPIIHFS